MRILGLDTATRATVVALLDTDASGHGAGVAAERRDDPPPGARPGHTAQLLELIHAVLKDTGAGWPEIDRLAVGTGPGTFTGLRIGIATALGLAHAQTLALVPVLTLRSLAAAAASEAAADGAASVVAVIDARRGEVFAAGWTVDAAGDPGSAPWLAPAALAPQALAEALGDRGRSCLAVGDGAVAFREALAPSGCRIPEDDSERHRVSALAHCRLASRMAPVAPEALRPEYLRLPDAEISRRAARR